MNGETTKSRNPHVPRSPEEIAADGIACVERGVAVLHNHIDNRDLIGKPAADRYGAGWAAIRERFPDVLLCPTTAAGPLEDRLSHFEECATAHGARMAPVDPGCMNMAISSGGVGETRMHSFVNTYDDIEIALDTMARYGMGASMGIYEPGFLRAGVAFKRAGKLPPGSMAKFYFFGGRNYFDGQPCIGFGLGPSAASLQAYIDIIGDSGLPWAVAVIGGCVFDSGIAKLAIERGGHIRLGLEDFAGDRTPSNLELLGEIDDLVRSTGRRLATPREAAEILGF